jgi:hypothetical protein
MPALLRRTLGSVLFLLALGVAGCELTPLPRELGTQQAPLTPDQVLPTGPTCSPSGGHGKHAPFACATCHVCGGVLSFDPAGPAVAPGMPLPSFDATTKTCASVACHGMYSGTFTYWRQGGDGEAEQNTVSYQGSGGNTPSWYASGLGCGACHGNPPRNFVWHGNHSTTNSGLNDCQLCHPDAVGLNGVGTALSTATNCGPTANLPCATLHRNGVVDVQPRFKSTCFGCH